MAAYRRSKAAELATAGRTYQQIADELGYSSRGTVHRIVRQALEAHEALEVENLRQVEVERLNTLQGPLWKAAKEGEVNTTPQRGAMTCRRTVGCPSRSLTTPDSELADRFERP